MKMGEKEVFGKFLARLREVALRLTSFSLVTEIWLEMELACSSWLDQQCRCCSGV